MAFGDGGAERRQFSLLQPDIIPKLQDKSFFVDVVIHNYILVAYRVGLFPTCSRRRAEEAFGFWQTDIRRTLEKGIDTPSKELDHFKHASFIAFWLRRMIPINEIRVDSPRGSDGSEIRDMRRERYFRYGNELSAFMIGYKICINYELGAIFSRPNAKNLRNKAEYIRDWDLPERLLTDYLMLWKHKNMSPYAFYLMYKSLFLDRSGMALGLTADEDPYIE